MDEFSNNIQNNNSTDFSDTPTGSAPSEPSHTVENTAPQEPVNSASPVTNTDTSAQQSAPVGTGTPYNSQVPPAGETVNTSFNGNNRYQTQDGQYNAPYNGAYTNSQPYNSGAYTNQNANPYGSSPYTVNPATSQQQFVPPTPKKKKAKPGKIIFVALICISIIVASVAIGLNSSNDETVSPDTEVTQKSGSQNSDNADANLDVEDSPVSYSEYSGEGTMTSEQIYKEVKEINVGVLVYSQNKKSGEGSGIVAGTDEDGKYTYILTAAHVISDSGVTVQVQFSDESEYKAEIIGYDTKTDVGVLRIEGSGFKSAKFGNSDKLTVGQTVYAIGNPGGTEFFGSFTSGMISAIDRPVPTTNSTYDLPCIQHNAAINPGNSGGALVNEYGQVVGLNSSKISSTEYEGMGFSVPSNTVVEVYKQIVKNGYVSNRPMLGITYFPVSSDYTYAAIAWKSDLPYGSVVIATINSDSDLSNRNIQVGDIITSVNGKELETTDILLEAIENGKVGGTLKLTICRLNNDGSINTTFEANVKLVEDKGTATVTEQETQTDPFSNYFPNFDY